MAVIDSCSLASRAGCPSSTPANNRPLDCTCHLPSSAPLSRTHLPNPSHALFYLGEWRIRNYLTPLGSTTLLAHKSQFADLIKISLSSALNDQEQQTILGYSIKLLSRTIKSSKRFLDILLSYYYIFYVLVAGEYSWHVMETVTFTPCLLRINKSCDI